MIVKNPKPSKSIDIEINFKGVGGHSSVPFKLKNPIVASFDFIHLIENKVWWSFSQFENVSLEPVDYDSGTKSNVVPETAYLKLHGAYSENEQLKKIKEIVKAGLIAIKDNYGVDSSVKFSA